MFSLKASGYMIKEKEYSEIYRPFGSGDYLFLYFPEQMKILIGNSEITTEKNSCIFYAPDDLQKFSGIPVFINTFVHFTDTAGEMKNFRFPTGKVFYPENYEHLNNIVKQIYYESLIKNYMTGEMIHSLLNELLIFISRCFSEESTNPIAEQLREMRRMLLQDCTKNISPDVLASELCMSKSRFYSCYKKLFNSSPKQDILAARMEKAALLLSDKNTTTNEVAKEVGFENVEHFIRYYKKHFGKTPKKDFRNTNQS